MLAPVFEYRKRRIEMAKSKKRQRGYSSVNSALLQRSVRKCWPIFLLPLLAAFAMGFIYPFCYGAYLSFCKFRIISKTEWVGFENYKRAFQDDGFKHAFWYTAMFAIVSLIIINVVAFALAYILTMGIKGTNVFRTVFFMPNLIGGIVLGKIWSMIINGILIKHGTDIITNAKWGFWGLIIVVCWQQIGYMMIIYIAGLQAVSEDINEAAKIDGATRMQTLFRVTIPNVMPSITICTFLSLTNGFKLFDQNLALTNGLPLLDAAASTKVGATEMLALNIVNTFNSNGKYMRGTAQAKAVIFFILVATISIIQLKATRSKEVQQ